MDPVTIAAGISAIGSLAGGAMSSAGASANNAANNQAAWQMAQFNAQQADKNRDWQERMSNSAYQRAMADMKQAGLNPILAYQQGGAGTPGGAQASGTAAHFENAMEGLGRGVASAGQAAGRRIELENVQAQAANQSSQAAVNKETVGLTQANTARAAQETATSAAELRRKDAETELLIQQSGNPEATRKLLQAQAMNQTAYGNYINQKTMLERYGDTRVGRAVTSGIELFKGANRAIQEHLKNNPIYLPGQAPSDRFGKNPTLEIDMRK
ncbi:MAG: DNA pilot protein [Microvirus sp.]|nr:MAG: DNA pilot protein [Microvirus sp.]